MGHPGRDPSAALSANDLEIGEVGLPQLVRAGGLVPELVGAAGRTT
jgi:hypothetical protein